VLRHAYLTFQQRLVALALGDVDPDEPRRRIGCSKRQARSVSQFTTGPRKNNPPKGNALPASSWMM